jgi:hypothetical protein
MNCASIEPRVALYAGGDLDGASARDVERHLEACPGCRDLLTVLRGQREAMGEWTSLDLPQDAMDDVRQGVLAAIGRGDAQPGLVDRIRVAPFRSMAWGSAGLAAAALLLVAAWPTSHWQEPAPAPVVAVAAPVPIDRDVRAPITHAAPDAAKPPAARPRPDATRTARAARLLASAPPAVLAEDAGTAAAVQTGPAGSVRRIEFQTADPNIRIIWLMPEAGPGPTRSGAPGR